LAETSVPKVCIEADEGAERLSVLWPDPEALTALIAVNSGPAWHGEIRAIDMTRAAAAAGTNRCDPDGGHDGAHCMGSPRSERAAKQRRLPQDRT
jgi:hypothetical protein